MAKAGTPPPAPGGGAAEQAKKRKRPKKKVKKATSPEDKGIPREVRSLEDGAREDPIGCRRIGLVLTRSPDPKTGISETEDSSQLGRVSKLVAP